MIKEEELEKIVSKYKNLEDQLNASHLSSRGEIALMLYKLNKALSC